MYEMILKKKQELTARSEKLKLLDDVNKEMMRLLIGKEG